MTFTKDDFTGLVVNEEGIPLLVQPDDEGFVDCAFKMENIRRVDDFLCFDMKAIFEDKSVGMSAQVFCEIGPGLTATAEGGLAVSAGGVYRPAVVLRSLGAPSDLFLATYLSLAGLTCDHPLAFVDEFSLTGIALHQEDIDILAEPVKIKLFGNDAEDDAPERYFESFFNLDVPNGYVCWNEKDPEYRIALLSSLSQ